MLVLGEISTYLRVNKDESRTYGDFSSCFLLQKEKHGGKKTGSMDGCHTPAVHQWAHARVAIKMKETMYNYTHSLILII